MDAIGDLLAQPLVRNEATLAERDIIDEVLAAMNADSNMIVSEPPQPRPAAAAEPTPTPTKTAASSGPSPLQDCPLLQLTSCLVQCPNCIYIHLYVHRLCRLAESVQRVMSTRADIQLWLGCVCEGIGTQLGRETRGQAG